MLAPGMLSGQVGELGHSRKHSQWLSSHRCFLQCLDQQIEYLTWWASHFMGHIFKILTLSLCFWNQEKSDVDFPFLVMRHKVGVLALCIENIAVHTGHGFISLTLFPEIIRKKCSAECTVIANTGGIFVPTTITTTTTIPSKNNKNKTCLAHSQS